MCAEVLNHCSELISLVPKPRLAPLLKKLMHCSPPVAADLRTFHTCSPPWPLYCSLPTLSASKFPNLQNVAHLCLQDFPARWIYEPWKAPIADQKQANCRIGVDYSKPMVDHAAVSKENIQKLKDAYAANPPGSKIKPPSHATPAAAATLAGNPPASQARQSPRATPAAKAALTGRKQATIPVGMYRNTLSSQ